MRNVFFALLAVVLIAVGGAFSAAPLTWSQSPDEAPQAQEARPDRGGNADRRFGPPGEFPGFSGVPGPFFGPPGGRESMLQAHPLWQALDLDGDGTLSAEELEQAARSLRKLDRDGDGTISPSELVEAFTAASGFPPGPPADFGRPGGPGPDRRSREGAGSFPPGPGGFPGGGFPGGGFPPMRQKRELIPEFDQDGDGYLNAEERAMARAESPATRGRGGPGFPGGPGFGRGGPGGRGGPPGGPGFGMTREAPKPGPRVSVDEVDQYPDKPLYEPGVLRTLFIEFDNEDWEAELADFKDTDVRVPATLVVDGVRYPDVGVSFRGMSSYMMVPAGFQRSFRLAFDFRDPEQNLYGYRTLNLLNQHGDPSLLSTVLYSHVARQYLPTPHANLVRVVVNGESWGIYTNLQQFNKDFLEENFGTTKGVRWKVPGSPMARGGLEYLGEEIEPYRAHYELKSKEKEASWRDLIELCRVLEETPTEDLEEELGKRMNLDSLLWFLALDVALINNDGYWTRSSDYSLYQDPDGLFHVLPYDMNEAFQGLMGGPMGMGGPGGGSGRRGGPEGRGPEGLGGPGSPGGGPGGRGQRGRGIGEFGRGGLGLGAGQPENRIALDPLVAMDDPRKPLRSKVLAVPNLRARYLECLKTIAQRSLDWEKLGPVVAQFRSLIEPDVVQETRRPAPSDDFLHTTASHPRDVNPKLDVNPEADSDDPSTDGASERRGGRRLSLRAFAEQRRAYLLEHPELRSP